MGSLCRWHHSVLLEGQRCRSPGVWRALLRWGVHEHRCCFGAGQLLRCDSVHHHHRQFNRQWQVHLRQAHTQTACITEVLQLRVPTAMCLGRTVLRMVVCSRVTPQGRGLQCGNAMLQPGHHGVRCPVVLCAWFYLVLGCIQPARDGYGWAVWHTWLFWLTCWVHEGCCSPPAAAVVALYYSHCRMEAICRLNVWFIAKYVL